MSEFVSRFDVPLPSERCVIVISYKDKSYLCEWIPNNIFLNSRPFMGCVKFLVGENEGLHLNVFDGQKYDFEFYKLVEI